LDHIIADNPVIRWLTRLFSGLFDFALRVRSQWAGHTAAYQPVLPGSPPRTPAQVDAYWQGLLAGAGDLAALALLHWRRPISSASVERAFSILTHMDTGTRRTMEESTEYDTLFLRANWRVVEILLQREADALAISHGHHKVESAIADKRKRVAMAAAAASIAAADALGGGDDGGTAASPSPAKRARPDAAVVELADEGESVVRR